MKTKRKPGRPRKQPPATPQPETSPTAAPAETLPATRPGNAITDMIHVDPETEGHKHHYPLLAIEALKQYQARGCRPRKWTDPREILEAANEYLQKAVDSGEHITLSGLAIWLDTDRETLLNYARGNHLYGDDPGFSDAIKRVRQICESFSENHGYSARNPAMSIFALKQHGWRDIQTIESTTTEIHTIDPDTRELLQGYMRQLAQAQRQVIDVTPADQVGNTVGSIAPKIVTLKKE